MWFHIQMFETIDEFNLHAIKHQDKVREFHLGRRQRSEAAFLTGWTLFVCSAVTAYSSENVDMLYLASLGMSIGTVSGISAVIDRRRANACERRIALYMEDQTGDIPLAGEFTPDLE